jgi:hypothetical protein
MSNEHERGIEAVAAKIRSPSTFPGETATKVAEELIAAYEAATPVDYRYSALALFKAVDAAISALTLKDDPGNGGDGEAERNFKLGDRVAKKSGSSWHGQIVGFYSTYLTPIGYCVESEREPGSVQIYPEAALVLSSYRKRSEADGLISASVGS